MMTNSHKILQPGEVTPDIKDFWRAAAERQDRINVLTRSPEWFEMMAEGREVACVSVCTDGTGSVTGILPMIKVQAPWGGDMLKVVGGEMLLDANRSGASLSEWMVDLYSELPFNASLFFDHLPASQLKALQDASQQSAIQINVERRDLVHHRLVLPVAPADLQELYSSRTAQKLRNAERRLLDVLGAVKFMDIRDFKDLEPIAQQVDAMMEGTWQAQKLGRRFSVDELKQVSERGWLRCFALQGNERVIAFAACYQGMGTLVYEVIGYDRRYAKYSPGKVLLHRLLENLYANDKPDFVDYGEGVADYKSGLSTDSIRINRVFVSKSGTSAAMAAGWHCLKQSVRNKASEIKRKVCR